MTPAARRRAPLAATRLLPVHLHGYSKSRRKAPIYWPLSTASGSYTLWLYYPALTSQTLYTAVNDFVEPKQAGRMETDRLAAHCAPRALPQPRRGTGARSPADLETELIELRDNLLQIAPT